MSNIPRRGYASGDPQPHHLQGNHQSGLRRPHLYSNRGSAFNTGNPASQPSAPVASHSRPDGSKAYVSSISKTNSVAQLPTANEYFAREAASSQRPRSPPAPLTRFANRFSHKPINTTATASSYGLPPTPESDVSLSRNTTPPKQYRDHQFNVDMMQRMTQHAKISPLGQYSYLKRELEDDNLLVDDGDVDRLVARANERVDASAARRVAFMSHQAVEGAREASRRLNGASTGGERPSSMYEIASKPVEPNVNSRQSMYAELRRTLSESSSEKPKRIVKQPVSKKQLPPLSPVQRRHVEIRPRRPIRTGSTSSVSHTPSPPQQNNSYYYPESRPTTAPAQEDPITNVDWLAAADDIAGDLPEKPRARIRPRTSSASGSPLAISQTANRQSEVFGGELRLDSTAIRSKLASGDSPTQRREPGQTGKQHSQPLTASQEPVVSNQSYLQQDLVDFLSEDDLTLSIHQENRSPVSEIHTHKRKNSGGSRAVAPVKPQEVSFLQSRKDTNPDETLDTLRQLSRLLSGNTPQKAEKPEVKIEPGLRRAVADATKSSDTWQPYKRQERPLQKPSGTPIATTVSSKNKVSMDRSAPTKDTELAALLNRVGAKKPEQPSKTPNPSQTPTSKTIQFEDGYETDDSLDRLLSHDTDYNSLLKPSAFEDESFIKGTLQVASQVPASRPNDIEGIALRAKVLNNLQTVQLDIRETRKGLESIERKFGMLEDDDTFMTAMEKEIPKPEPVIDRKLPQRQYAIVPRKKQQKLQTKGIFRRPWGFKDFFFAFVFLLFTLLLVEYKLWSDTIIPQYSRVSSDEWFAKHPVGAYKPGGTFRAIFRASVWMWGIVEICLDHILAFLLWILSGIQWLEVRVMDAVSPLPPEFQFVRTGIPEALPSTTTTTTLDAATTTVMEEFDVETLLPL